MKKNVKFKQVLIITVIILLFQPVLINLSSPQSGQVFANEGISRSKAYAGLAFTTLLAYSIRNFRRDSEGSSWSEETIDYDNDDLYWLARAVTGEARGEPYRGQIAVAAVIINRVKSEEFPDTIYDVIYQPGQFAAVDDGQINLAPVDSAYSAAREALRGNDPSQGALYFYNPDTARTLWWLETREKTVRIGDHVFAE